MKRFSGSKGSVFLVTSEKYTCGSTVNQTKHQKWVFQRKNGRYLYLHYGKQCPWTNYSCYLKHKCG